MDNLTNKIMQYFHDRLVANGIDPAEIKGTGSITGMVGTKKKYERAVVLEQRMQYSFLNNSRARGPGEAYIRLNIDSAHQAKIKSERIPDMSTVLTTMIVTGAAKRFTISIAAQELKSDAYKSGGKVVLNEKGKIIAVNDIPDITDPKDLRAILQKGLNYQTAIGALVDHFCEYHMPAPRHRVLWKDGEYK